MHLRLDEYVAPLATLLLVTDDEGRLCALEFGDHRPRMLRLLNQLYGDVALEKGAAPPAVIQALDDYFAGSFAALDDLEIAAGGTPFQRAVWRAVRAVPAATTNSYGEIAAVIGSPKASRAVGAANGSNPIAIVVPCHRVIGSDGGLTGYGGGLPRKRWLLEHESRTDVPKSAASRRQRKLALA
jgi:methylated-DNA-[protein]-cysteine S-methyltransferase